MLHEGKYRVSVDDDQQLTFVNLLNERIEVALFPQFPDQECDALIPLVIERNNQEVGLTIDEKTCGTKCRNYCRFNAFCPGCQFVSSS
jgi:hypothetical protein